MDHIMLLSFVLIVFSMSSVVAIPKSGIFTEEIDLFFNPDINKVWHIKTVPYLGA